MIVMQHHRRWLTLFICVSAFLLVMHLSDRFAQPGLTIHKTARGAAPGARWQQLQCDALRWTMPAPKVGVLPRLQVVRFVETAEQLQLPLAPLAENLCSRPPPSC
jgi:hypothetical protein